MGIWGTHHVNITQQYIKTLKRQGCEFCYIHENEVIFRNYTNDKLNEQTDKPKEQTDKSKKQNSVTEEQSYVFTTEYGDKINGNIFHLVNGSVFGSGESNWFIVRPIKKPVNDETVVVEEL